MADTDFVGAFLGPFGKWQLRSTLLIFLVKIPSAWFMACVSCISSYFWISNLWFQQFSAHFYLQKSTARWGFLSTREASQWHRTLDKVRTQGTIQQNRERRFLQLLSRIRECGRALRERVVWLTKQLSSLSEVWTPANLLFAPSSVPTVLRPASLGSGNTVVSFAGCTYWRNYRLLHAQNVSRVISVCRS